MHAETKKDLVIAMDWVKLSAIATIILALVGVLTFWDSRSVHDHSVYDNSVGAISVISNATSGGDSQSNVTINNSTTMIDGRVVVGGNGIAIGPNSSVVIHK